MGVYRSLMHILDSRSILESINVFVKFRTRRLDLPLFLLPPLLKQQVYFFTVLEAGVQDQCVGRVGFFGSLSPLLAAAIPLLWPFLRTHPPVSLSLLTRTQSCWIRAPPV